MLVSGLYVQRACDGGCTTRFDFPCSSEARKENIQRLRQGRKTSSAAESDIEWWSLAIVDPQTKCMNMDKLCVFAILWQIWHGNTIETHANFEITCFHCFFSGECFQMHYKRMFCHKLGSKRRFGFFRGERGLRAKVTTECFPKFSPNFLRSFRASFCGRRRPEKIHQKSPPFFNAKFPGKFEENIHKIVLESGQSKISPKKRRPKPKIETMVWVWANGEGKGYSCTLSRRSTQESSSELVRDNVFAYTRPKESFEVSF